MVLPGEPLTESLADEDMTRAPDDSFPRASRYPSMLTVMEIILGLKRIPLFSSVHGEGLKRLSDVIREKKVSQGETIFSENDLGEDMYLVHSGRVGLYHEVSGTERLIASVGEGGYFGEMALIDEEPRSATARAELDATLLVLNKGDFRMAVQDYPDIAFDVFREFSRRLRRADERIRRLSRKLQSKHIETS